MSSLRSLVTRELDEAGVLLPEQKHVRMRREAFAAGKRLLPHALPGDSASLFRAAAQSLDLAEPVIARLLGFGWQQADGLAALAATPKSERSEVGRLGALFNLGIALFDNICDRFPARSAPMLARITPEFLDAHMAGGRRPPPLTGDPPIDLLVTLIVEFLFCCRALGGSRRDQRNLRKLIRTMYGAERYSIAARREGGLPTLHVWRQLRRKSALPMATMAQLALLPHQHADDTQRHTMRLSARLAGDAIWIIDDLADVREDWNADCWSRPLWLLANRATKAPTDADEALRRITSSGIAVAEARRLADRLLRLCEIAEADGPAFVQSVQATVHSWIDLLPD